MKVEGSPVLGLFGFLEWWLLAVAIAALYGFQVISSELLSHERV
jgi:hypothetical protein